MARTVPAPTRERLLEHGVRLARRAGLRGLTVRGLCEAAGANPGSFVYHFGSRDRYLAELIESAYAPMFARMQRSFDEDGPPLVRLRAMLGELLHFIVARDSLIAQLVLDGFAGERAAASFLRGLGSRHPQLLLRCIAQAQAAGQLRPAAPEHQLLFLMSAIGMPALVQGLIGKRRALPQLLRDTFARHAADPASVEQRLDWALQGLRPGPSESLP